MQGTTIDPSRPWVGRDCARRRIFVLGESYTGDYESDLEYDDSYLAALLDGKKLLGPDLFFKIVEKLEIPLAEFWHEVAFTNMSLGSLGATNATKVTPAQLKAGQPRLEQLLGKLTPRGVLILGKKTGKAAEPVCRKLGVAYRTVNHPSGINNANPRTACSVQGG